MERIAPSARLEAQIAELLTDGLAADGDKLLGQHSSIDGYQAIAWRFAAIRKRRQFKQNYPAIEP
jgi:hypothetical protein